MHVRVTFAIEVKVLLGPFNVFVNTICSLVNELVDGLIYGRQWGQTYTSANHCHTFVGQGLEFFWENVA
jgi:hypothetical protein